MIDINVSEIIATPFHDVYRDVMAHRHTFYALIGGRGSTKSSFWGITLVLLIKKNPGCHAVVLRKVAGTLRDSVYAQVKWAIDKLGCNGEFNCTVSPMEITHIPTGQKIFFRGADDPVKIKSIKSPFGYIGITIFEEIDQFNGIEEIRSIQQSTMRGGSKYWTFYCCNPPKSMQNWVNIEFMLNREDRLVHKSTYQSVPVEWLGEQFFHEADVLRISNEKAYRHEYLGEPVGTGGNVFENISLRDITQEEMIDLRSGYILRGVDWGWFPDPVVYLEVRYTNNKLYFLGNEIYANKLSNEDFASRIESFGTGAYEIICDSANPKDIQELRNYGLNSYAAYKFPGSVDTGIKWLQSLEEIVIDPRINPIVAKEFSVYEYQKTKDGEYISSYPDKDNHCIDATRYAITRLLGNAK